MCGERWDSESSEPIWRPVNFTHGWARFMMHELRGRREDFSMQVRILCGAYDPKSPFIEGGCSFDWMECLAQPDCALSCPRCGQECQEEWTQCARVMLKTRAVFVLGCPHLAFTFSRRGREPYFSPEPDRVNADEDRDRQNPSVPE